MPGVRPSWICNQRTVWIFPLLRTFIEKEFTFDTAGYTDLSFHVNAYYSGNQSDQTGDDEKFVFQYLDESESSWVKIIDISPTDNADDDVYHIFTGIPLSSTTITVRVVSEIQNLIGNNGRDDLSIDHMLVRCGGDGGPNPTPSLSPSPTPTPTTTPSPSQPPGDLSLTATGFKVQGQQNVNLDRLQSAQSDEVTVTRTLISGKGTSGTFNTANDGNHVDQMTTRGGSVYDYEVCEAGTSVCSNVSRVTFCFEWYRAYL